jgi:dTDP-4-amino-4,6-dideoxygalactose transaminase
VKLAYLDAHNACRREAMSWYCELLPRWCRPVATHPAAEPVHHLAVVRPPDRDRLLASLDVRRIAWGLHYPVPCHRQPAFVPFAQGPLPITEEAAERVVSLPIFAGISREQVERVCAAVQDAESGVHVAS